MDPASVVVVVRRSFTFSNIFSSEIAWPIKAKFYVEPPWEGGTKVYINGPGHMTKNRRVDFHETRYVASRTPVHHSVYK